jgi:hypothetical protein
MFTVAAPLSEVGLAILKVSKLDTSCNKHPHPHLILLVQSCIRPVVFAQHGHRHRYARQGIFRDFATKVSSPPASYIHRCWKRNARALQDSVANAVPHTIELNLYVPLLRENCCSILILGILAYFWCRFHYAAECPHGDNSQDRP